MFHKVAESQKPTEDKKEDATTESQKPTEDKEDATATAAAGLIEKLSVEEKKSEGKDGEEAPSAAKEEKESKT